MLNEQSNTFKKIEIILSSFLTTVELNRNQQQKEIGKSTNNWKLNNRFLNNP
jgi:hypothetical protein